ncbi:hypothetical protein EFR01_08420 [Sinorhizobium fredii]|nr:hypothetical protein EFR01_08420 [Sinorhizobium fredii]GLS06606.1 hypothetical protein GCM10007864_02310 [Sinorhizobium fredii]
MLIPNIDDERNEVPEMIHATVNEPSPLKPSDLEDPICRLLNMTRIAVSHIEGVVNFEHSIGHLSDGEASAVIFALYEVQSRAKDLRDKFYWAVHGQHL